MELVEKMLEGDARALARLITLIENRADSLPEIMKAVHPRLGHAYKVGITGPPGAGKSTTADRLVEVWRKTGARVGAVLIDPSSPFTGGAILGDRIRMNRHTLDSGVFMRSLGSRGTQGGLSRATKEVVHLFDAFGMDWVLIETVGVGQTELDIMGVADTVTVVLGPESGDTVQTMKAGLMEIADVFAVNKADREGAGRMAAMLKAMLELKERVEGEWEPPVLQTVASTGKGIEELNEAILSHRNFQVDCKALDERRRKIRRAEFMEVMQNNFRRNLEANLADDPLRQVIEKIENGDMSPYEALEVLTKNVTFNEILSKNCHRP